MFEKLVENWLDSASERSYQAPFCQMLAAKGHTVVHSTRHAPTEFGKDVITVDANGVPWAFQLKGNPSGRLTKSQVAEIASQLDELVVYAITHPGVPHGKKHKCVLVTNGNIEEEASEAINALNLSLQQRGHGKNRIEVWTRGTLLKMAAELGTNLWPSDVSDLNLLLELLVHRGDDIFPAAKLHHLLHALLLLSETETQPVTKAELARRITSSAILVSVSLRTFSLKENHFAALTAWIMFVTYAGAAMEKRSYQLSGPARRALELAKSTVYDLLVALCNDVIRNPKLAPSVGSVIAPFHRARATLIYALISIYWLWADKRGWIVSDHRAFIEGWIPRNFANSLFWGEACVPQLIAHYWLFSRLDASIGTEGQLGALLNFVVQVQRGQLGTIFPGPYFSFDVVQAHLMRDVIPVKDDPLAHEAPTGSTFVAEWLFHIFVRKNLKAPCQLIWPEFTKLILRCFYPEHRWAYAMSHCDRGTEDAVVPTLNKRWRDLVNDARNCQVTSLPPSLVGDEFVFALFVVLFPYRATSEAMRYLDYKLGSSWLIADAITDS